MYNGGYLAEKIHVRLLHLLHQEHDLLLFVLYSGVSVLLQLYWYFELRTCTYNIESRIDVIRQDAPYSPVRFVSEQVLQTAVVQ